MTQPGIELWSSVLLVNKDLFIFGLEGVLLLCRECSQWILILVNRLLIVQEIVTSTEIK